MSEKVLHPWHWLRRASPEHVPKLLRGSRAEPLKMPEKGGTCLAYLSVVYTPCVRHTSQRSTSRAQCMPCLLSGNTGCRIQRLCSHVGTLPCTPLTCMASPCCCHWPPKHLRHTRKNAPLKLVQYHLTSSHTQYGRLRCRSQVC